MLVGRNHSEPSNTELGIKPWPKSVMYPLTAIASIGVWFLLFVAFA